MDRRYMNDSYHTAVTEDEIHRIYSILDKKANSADVMEALQNKANK